MTTYVKNEIKFTMYKKYLYNAYTWRSLSGLLGGVFGGGISFITLSGAFCF